VVVPMRVAGVAAASRVSSRSRSHGGICEELGDILVNLLPKRAVLAITAVVDIALHTGPPVGARSLTARHNLSPRHLELLLPGLVQAKILKGTRGPRGGYQLARERRKITAGEIVRTALALSTAAPIGARSDLFKKVIEPAVRKAADGFLANLDAITVEDLCAEAVGARILESDEGVRA
jgi:Rrf2 family transcriptional regulator, iron-sulfur cluster assembly transcription factor